MSQTYKTPTIRRHLKKSVIVVISNFVMYENYSNDSLINPDLQCLQGTRKDTLMKHTQRSKQPSVHHHRNQTPVVIPSLNLNQCFHSFQGSVPKKRVYCVTSCVRYDYTNYQIIFPFFYGCIVEVLLLLQYSRWSITLDSV